MKKLKNLDDVFSDKERMELIWVKEGIKPVGEIKKNASEYKQVLDALGFYTEIYDNRLLYSTNPELVKELKHAINSRNYDKEGKFWGFPSCCSEYFTELQRKGLDAYSESLKMAKNRLRKSQDLPAYFSDYVVCPTCSSTRNSASGKLEERMTQALKSEDYRLYEKFKEESNGRLRYLPAQDGDGIILWDYSKPKDYADAKKY